MPADMCFDQIELAAKDRSLARVSQQLAAGSEQEKKLRRRVCKLEQQLRHQNHHQPASRSGSAAARRALMVEPASSCWNFAQRWAPNPSASMGLGAGAVAGCVIGVTLASMVSLVSSVWNSRMWLLGCTCLLGCLLALLIALVKLLRGQKVQGTAI